MTDNSYETQSATRYPVVGAGLGLRRGLLHELAQTTTSDFDFLELAPENWIGVGGRFGKQFRSYAERFPLVCHGLSLSIGSPAALDMDFLGQVRAFLDRYDVRCYSEHLSYCGDEGHLYDLMPIPFTEAAVRYVADRVKQVQDVLERRIVLEHVSAYVAQSDELSEIEFVNAVVAESDCDLLIDVNNVFVNATNFGFDAFGYISRLPSDRIAYGHIAGHFEEAEDLLVDTHGSPIIEGVWELLDHAYAEHGVFPTLLERDFNFPGLPALKMEVERIRGAQRRAATLPAKPLPERDAQVYRGREVENVSAG